MKVPETTMPASQAAPQGAASALPEQSDFIIAHRHYMLPAFLMSFIWIALAAVGTISAGPSPLRAALVGLAVVVFMGIYLLVALYRRHDLRWTIALLFAIAAALSILDRLDWTALFVFCSVAAGLRLSRPLCWYVIGLSGSLAAATTIIGGGSSGSAISIAVSALAVGFMILAVARLLKANTELREAREQLAAIAVREERLRFARDLHDLLGHSLSVIALKADLVGQLIPPDSTEAAKNVDDIRSVARSALGEVREAVSGYREPQLAAEVAGARFALSAAGIQATIIESRSAFPRDIDSLMAWAVREGTTNVLRHSGAHHCQIAIEGTNGQASLEIEDDGRATDSVGTTAGNGIAGLRERAERLSGRVEAGMRPEGGFCLRVSAPLIEVKA